MKDLVDANIYLLDQAERLLLAMPDHDYAEPDRGLYGSSLGQHLRHCLDHYSSFLRGISGGQVDYDHRERAENLECSTDCAVGEIQRVRDALREAIALDFTSLVQVRMDCGGGDNRWHSSTLGRELQFLVSHTVHHFAMIHGMCHQRGMTVEEGFGLAPSTIKHRSLVSID